MATAGDRKFLKRRERNGCLHNQAAYKGDRHQRKRTDIQRLPITPLASTCRSGRKWVDPDWPIPPRRSTCLQPGTQHASVARSWHGSHKRDVRGGVVTCHTSVGPREAGGFGIAIKMQVRIPTLPKDEAPLWLKRRTRRSVRTAMRRAEILTSLPRSKAPRKAQ